jgi:crotonobetainyl-CoA:carnitine CoA-transferase CaiB-like acyl-CoA transferase
MVVDLEHPIIGPMQTIAPPTRFSELEFDVRSPAPWLGQHTASVLTELGVEDDEIDRLFSEGILFDAHAELQEGHK